LHDRVKTQEALDVLLVAAGSQHLAQAFNSGAAGALVVAVANSSRQPVVAYLLIGICEKLLLQFFGQLSVLKLLKARSEMGDLRQAVGVVTRRRVDRVSTARDLVGDPVFSAALLQKVN
jgi:hypothetical protein